MNRPQARVASLLVALVFLAGAGAPAAAQFQIRPLVGFQTIIFNGDNQASRPISPGNDVALAFGGGLSSANNAARIGIELVPDPLGMFRIPISAEYYWFDGKTTFAVPSTNNRVQQLRLHYSATMFSAGAGLRASFYNDTQLPLYVSAEGRFNYLPPTSLNSRRFYLDTGEPVNPDDPERTIVPSTQAQSRIGAIIKFGVQADFFDPLILDFNVGYGAINLFGKNTDPTTRRDILVAEPTLTSVERTLGFLTLGLSVHWTL